MYYSVAEPDVCYHYCYCYQDICSVVVPHHHDAVVVAVAVVDGDVVEQLFDVAVAADGDDIAVVDDDAGIDVDQTSSLCYPHNPSCCNNGHLLYK